jgi:uncharacterized delta-60 repeat protein
MRKSLLTVAVLVLSVSLVTAAAAASGDLDPSFGTGGKVTTDFGGDDAAYDVALQPNGKIVAAGSDGQRFALSRYTTAGSLDRTFGSDGRVTTSFSGSSAANAVAVQANGKVTAGGSGDTKFALARYDANGTLDATFGLGGKVTTQVGGSGSYSSIAAIAIQPDGKIVAAGGTDKAEPFPAFDFALARYNDDGTLDERFGSGGIVTARFGIYFGATSVALQADRKIVVGGGDGHANFVLARYNADGSLDTTFGSNGKVTTAVGVGTGVALGLAIQPNRKIVAAGYAFLNGGFEFALARYNVDGTLDASFGNSGIVTTAFGDGFFRGEAFSVAVESDGRIVAAGEGPVGNDFGFAVARYDATGNLDPTFGSGGRVTTRFEGGAGGLAYAVKIQPDRSIVTAGQTLIGTSNDFALARYLP